MITIKELQETLSAFSPDSSISVAQNITKALKSGRVTTEDLSRYQSVHVPDVADDYVLSTALEVVNQSGRHLIVL